MIRWMIRWWRRWRLRRLRRLPNKIKPIHFSPVIILGIFSCWFYLSFNCKRTPKLQHVWVIGALGMGVLSFGGKGGQKDGGKFWSSVWVSTHAIDLLEGLRFPKKSIRLNGVC